MIFSETLDMLQKILQERVSGLQATVTYQETALGDVKDTFADRTHVHRTIGYEPTISFVEGLAREVDWAIARRRN